MTTIGETISRSRGLMKALKQDAFLTDRFLYSLTLKHAKLYIKRMDDRNKIMKFQSLFEPLPCVELKEVDAIEACCLGIQSGVYFKRTVDKLPAIFEGTFGPLFRTISSIDGSTIVQRTYPATFVHIANSSDYKYNKTLYCWYLNEHLYFPNLDWDAVRIEGLWEDSIRLFTPDESDDCILRQDEKTHVPDYLFAEIENNVKADLMGILQIPPDGKTDNQSLLKD